MKKKRVSFREEEMVDMKSEIFPMLCFSLILIVSRRAVALGF